jgi:hypothetical protein
MTEGSEEERQTSRETKKGVCGGCVEGRRNPIPTYRAGGGQDSRGIPRMMGTAAEPKGAGTFGR